MNENQVQAAIAGARQMFRRFVTVRYWNYLLGVIVGLGLGVAGNQLTEGGYWVKSLAILTAAGVVAVDVFTAIALHGHYRSMMQQSERLGDSHFAPSMSSVQTVFLFSIAPAIAFAASSCAVVACFHIF